MLSVKSSFGGFTSPYVYVIPADTVIFYNGPYISPVEGWDIYSSAVNKFISGTATQVEVGVVTAASGSTVSTAGTLGTAGLHYGSSVNSVGGAGAYDRNMVSAGDHTHTVTPASVTDTTELKPIHTTLTVLRTATEQRFFPVNTIHINETNLVNGTQKFSTNLVPRYISGGVSVSSVEANSHAASFTVSSYNANSHNHMPLGSSYQTGATTGLTTEKYINSGTYTHFHPLTSSASIHRLRGKLLKLWVAASRQLPKSATIVMYCGDLSILPSYWKVCDGTNGTIDMQGFFIGHAPSTSFAHGEAYGTATTYNLSAPTVASDNYAHAHYLVGTSNLSFLYRPHGFDLFPHTHALSGASLTSNAFPANIKLAFIQLII